MRLVFEVGAAVRNALSCAHIHKSVTSMYRFFRSLKLRSAAEAGGEDLPAPRKPLERIYLDIIQDGHLTQLRHCTERMPST